MFHLRVYWRGFTFLCAMMRDIAPVFGDPFKEIPAQEKECFGYYKIRIAD